MGWEGFRDRLVMGVRMGWMGGLVTCGRVGVYMGWVNGLVIARMDGLLTGGRVGVGMG